MKTTGTVFFTRFIDGLACATCCHVDGSDTPAVGSQSVASRFHSRLPHTADIYRGEVGNGDIPAADKDEQALPSLGAPRSMRGKLAATSVRPSYACRWQYRA